MTRRTAQVLSAGLLLLAGLLVAGTVWTNVVLLRDAFGSGPPYYGRSTNMDKWSDPRPLLGAIDVAVLLGVVGAVRWGRRRLRRDLNPIPG